MTEEIIDLFCFIASILTYLVADMVTFQMKRSRASKHQVFELPD